MKRLNLIFCALAFFIAGLSTGCRGQRSTDEPIGWIRNMHETPRYDPQEPGPYFEDGRAMRPPVANAVAREMPRQIPIESGVNYDGTYLPTVPNSLLVEAAERANPEATPNERMQAGRTALAERGQDRYGIYCVPCHGGLGDGQGMVPEVSGEATIRPPSFHEDRIRHMPDGQLYATIRNGLGNMPAYNHQIPVDDRWAIVSYVRVLQLHLYEQSQEEAEEGEQ